MQGSGRHIRSIEFTTYVLCKVWVILVGGVPTDRWYFGDYRSSSRCIEKGLIGRLYTLVAAQLYKSVSCDSQLDQTHGLEFWGYFRVGSWNPTEVELTEFNSTIFLMLDLHMCGSKTMNENMISGMSRMTSKWMVNRNHMWVHTDGLFAPMEDLMAQLFKMFIYLLH